MAQDFSLEKNLYNDYVNWQESSLTHRRFKHADIQPLINKVKDNPLFTVTKVGISEQGREINLIKIGTGKIKVFLWSQMHGDEPTATMALFDLFNFFGKSNNYDKLKKEILNNLTLYFIPMVNPDGAEFYTRRNINKIDLNRDAVKQQSAEGRLLKTMYDSIKADFGFNLHDQSSRYSVGRTPKTTAIAFLAPPFNEEKDTNVVRNRAINLIAFLNHMLNGFIPGHIAKYSDDFEPRAFGDNFQKWGMSTVLIESGGWISDPEKQFLRRLNFVILISAFNSIAKGLYQSYQLADYDNIPFNDNYVYDLLLKNLTLKSGDSCSVVDVAINRVEKNTPDLKSFYFTGSIAEIGDTTGRYGIEEFDLTGYEALPGNMYPVEFDSLSQVYELDYDELFAKGFIYVKVKNFDSASSSLALNKLPVNVLFNSTSENFSRSFDVDDRADFILVKNGIVEFVCVNGFLRNTVSKAGSILNGSQIR